MANTLDKPAESREKGDTTHDEHYFPRRRAGLRPAASHDAVPLRQGGLLLLSFITPASEWRPNNPPDFEYQRWLFSEMLPVKWQSMRSEQQTREQLAAAGLQVVAIEYDSQRMFLAVLARKR